MTEKIIKVEEPMFFLFVRAYGFNNIDEFNCIAIALLPLYVRQQVYKKISDFIFTYIEVHNEKYDLFLDMDSKVIYYVASWIY